MHRQKIASCLLLLFTLIAVATVVVAFRSPNQVQASTEDEGYAPVTDFTASKSHDDKRRAKGRRYKLQQTAIEEIASDGKPLPVISHWWRGLPALPADLSDLIVKGEVTNARAYLSEDNTGIYSEFTVKIDEVFKGSNPVSADQQIVVERMGGAVRFPSGKAQRYGVYQQGMPRPGGQYLFFLRRNAEDEDFYIVTGYELRAGRITPLDGNSEGEQNPLPFAVYKNANEDSFLNALRVAITESSQAKRGRDQ